MLIIYARLIFAAFFFSTVVDREISISNARQVFAIWKRRVDASLVKENLDNSKLVKHA